MLKNKPHIILGALVIVILVSGCISNQSTYPEDTTLYEECDSCCSPCPTYNDTTPFSECDSCCPEDITPYAECNSCCSECPPTQQEALLQCEESLEQCETEINSTCYKNNMISQLQAENIAKHLASIQTDVPISDVKVWFSSTIGEKCNPDWLVTLRFNDTQNDNGYLWWVRVNGQIENTTLQGIVDLPDDYVLSKVEADYEYHTSISQFPYVGSGSSHSSPY